MKPLARTYIDPYTLVSAPNQKQQIIFIDDNMFLQSKHKTLQLPNLYIYTSFPAFSRSDGKHIII